MSATRDRVSYSIWTAVILSESNEPSPSQYSLERFKEAVDESFVEKSEMQGEEADLLGEKEIEEPEGIVVPNFFSAYDMDTIHQMNIPCQFTQIFDDLKQELMARKASYKLLDFDDTHLCIAYLRCLAAQVENQVQPHSTMPILSGISWLCNLRAPTELNYRKRGLLF